MLGRRRWPTGSLRDFVRLKRKGKTKEAAKGSWVQVRETGTGRVGGGEGGGELRVSESKTMYEMEFDSLTVPRVDGNISSDSLIFPNKSQPKPGDSSLLHSSKLISSKRGHPTLALIRYLGGATFVTCVVVGIISILAKQEEFRVNIGSFVRDVCFFLLVLASLIFILIYGKINLWGAMGFLSMYIVYVMVVYFSQVLWNDGRNESERDVNPSYCSDLNVPILNSMEKGEQNYLKECGLECGTEVEMNKCCFAYDYRLLVRWSKPTTVASMTLAHVLLSTLWNAQDDSATFNKSLMVYGIGLMFGMTFGVLAYATTEKSSPPRSAYFLG
ncbi:unnamed protein product [Dovyalis caffra]|uniref:Sodium/calcium exchanger membrane region domain-containing protein n=1 Tax=Dovyalis caffra TaxID=77055 RepID=A0AAV1RYC9_9ROSI|nr:unnamed protein product [Dovyalis caffra]